MNEYKIENGVDSTQSYLALSCNNADHADDVSLCASTNTLGRFINYDITSSFVYDAHVDSCTKYGSDEIIEKNNQFIHVEIEGFWRDQVELMAEFYAEYFPGGI